MAEDKVDAFVVNDGEENSTIIKYVPESWAEFFPQKSVWVFDSNANNGEGSYKEVKPQKPTWLMFEAFTTPQVEYTQRVRGEGMTPYIFTTSDPRGKYAFLYPNTQISERIAHTYNADSSTFASAVNQMWEKATSMVAAIKQLKSSSTGGAVYDSPYIWASMERRTFQVTLKLYAFTDLEKDIYGPIRFFRTNSLPSQAGGNLEKRLNIISYPSVFRITGGAFNTMGAAHGLNYYNLTNVNVEFSDETKFLIEGVPINAKIDLTFQECIKIYKNLLDKTPIQVHINEMIGPNGKEPTKGDFKPGITDTNNNTTLARITAFAKSTAKGTAVYRLAANARERATNEAIGYVIRKIQASSLFKAVDDAVNLDPLHRLEMQKYLVKNKPRSSESIEPTHLEEVKDIMEKVR